MESQTLPYACTVRAPLTLRSAEPNLDQTPAIVRDRVGATVANFCYFSALQAQITSLHRTLCTSGLLNSTINKIDGEVCLQQIPISSSVTLEPLRPNTPSSAHKVGGYAAYHARFAFPRPLPTAAT